MTSPTSCRSLGWARTTRVCTNAASQTPTTESWRSTRLKPTLKSTPPSTRATGPLRRALRCTWPIRNPARAARLSARTATAWAPTRGPRPLLPRRRHTPKQWSAAQGQVRVCTLVHCVSTCLGITLRNRFSASDFISNRLRCHSVQGILNLKSEVSS